MPSYQPINSIQQLIDAGLVHLDELPPRSKDIALAVADMRLSRWSLPFDPYLKRDTDDFPRITSQVTRLSHSADTRFDDIDEARLSELMPSSRTEHKTQIGQLWNFPLLRNKQSGP